LGKPIGISVQVIVVSQYELELFDGDVAARGLSFGHLGGYLRDLLDPVPHIERRFVGF